MTLLDVMDVRLAWCIAAHFWWGCECKTVLLAPGLYIYIKLLAPGGHAAGAALMNATVTAGSYTHTHVCTQKTAYIGCAQRENTCTFVCARTRSWSLKQTRLIKLRWFSPPSAALIVVNASVVTVCGAAELLDSIFITLFTHLADVFQLST